ncbi:hypothetical protein [Nocardia farcinica]|uniref:hypothetical protein n=1 Tax=Nocardia farcinica TaxID=37329 RepID=UPI000BF88000|nr:hypothetical protein [Nocardia farcinica]
MDRLHARGQIGRRGGDHQAVAEHADGGQRLVEFPVVAGGSVEQARQFVGRRVDLVGGRARIGGAEPGERQGVDPGSQVHDRGYHLRGFGGGAEFGGLRQFVLDAGRGQHGGHADRQRQHRRDFPAKPPPGENADDATERAERALALQVIHESTPDTHNRKTSNLPATRLRRNAP